MLREPERRDRFSVKHLSTFFFPLWQSSETETRSQGSSRGSPFQLTSSVLGRYIEDMKKQAGKERPERSNEEKKLNECQHSKQKCLYKLRYYWFLFALDKICVTHFDSLCIQLSEPFSSRTYTINPPQKATRQPNPRSAFPIFCFFFAKKEREKRWNRTMIYILLQPVDTFALFFEPAPFYYPSYHHRHCPLAVDCRSSKRSFSSKTKTQNHTARRSRKHIRVKAKTRKRTQKRQRK